MLQELWNRLQVLLGLGLDVQDVNALQMALRTIVIYAFTLALIRLGSKRFLGKSSALDIIVGIMLGSVMSRGINGSAPFFPTLAAGVVMVGMHWLLATLAYHMDWFGPLVKGDAVLLIKDGQVQQREVRRTGITPLDFAEALRLQSEQSDPSKVKLAHLERDGSISIIPFEREPQVIDVSVASGVQTVRIELG